MELSAGIGWVSGERRRDRARNGIEGNETSQGVDLIWA
jgi:hypothetical protein